MLIYYGVMEHLAPWRERTPHKQSSSFYNRHCSILLHHPKVPRKVRLPYPAGEQVGNLCPGGCTNVTADSEVVAFSAQGLDRRIAQDSTLNPRPKTTQTLTQKESGSLAESGQRISSRMWCSRPQPTRLATRRWPPSVRPFGGDGAVTDRAARREPGC